MRRSLGCRVTLNRTRPGQQACNLQIPDPAANCIAIGPGPTSRECTRNSIDFADMQIPFYRLGRHQIRGKIFP